MRRVEEGRGGWKRVRRVEEGEERVEEGGVGWKGEEGEEGGRGWKGEEGEEGGRGWKNWYVKGMEGVVVGWVGWRKGRGRR